MSLNLYADINYVDDIASTRGYGDLYAALVAKNPDHPLTSFVSSGQVDIPEVEAQAIDTFVELIRIDQSTGTEVDNVLQRLVTAIQAAFDHRPRKLIISTGNGSQTDVITEPLPESVPVQESVNGTMNVNKFMESLSK